MPKLFREWRNEAAQINANAQAQGQPEPIPDYTKLRLKPLAKQVLQARLEEENRGGGR